MSKITALPTARRAPLRENPKFLIIYGPPKVGKTGFISTLPDDHLFLDCEGGTELTSCISVSISSTEDIYQVIKLIITEGGKRKAAGKSGSDLFPYRFLIIDTLDILEEFCVISATDKYKSSTLGKNFEGKSVLELPNGLGYYYVREEVKEVLNKLGSVCKYMIGVSHTKDVVQDKGGVQVSSTDISLTGKLGKIIASAADAIGYMHRNKKDNSKLNVSFNHISGETMSGTRIDRLAGTVIPADWGLIYKGDIEPLENYKAEDFKIGAKKQETKKEETVESLPK